MELKKVNKLTVCNFCGQNIDALLEKELRLLRSQISESAICDGCVVRIEGGNNPKKRHKVTSAPVKVDIHVSEEGDRLLTPQEVYQLLGKHVAGQDEAKRAIAIAVANHLRTGSGKQKKSNVLLMGPSGTGKTEMARALAAELDIPFYAHDATNLTTYGYVGKDVESIVQNLLAMCGNNPQKAERAIVFIDEIDKKADRGVNSGDIGTNMVQDALLKMIEGDKVVVGNKDQKITVNTSKILFICAGAFSGIRLEAVTKKSIGLSKTSTKTKEVNLIQALTEYGMKQEFLRRFSVIARTYPHTEESLLSVLDGKKNSVIETYRGLYQTYGLEFVIDKKFQQELVQEAISTPLPIAELNQRIEQVSQKILFDPGINKSFRVTLTSEGYFFNKRKRVTPYDEQQ